jgi:hypothetical protein
MGLQSGGANDLPILSGLVHPDLYVVYLRCYKNLFDLDADKTMRIKKIKEVRQHVIERSNNVDQDKPYSLIIGYCYEVSTNQKRSSLSV